MRKKTESSLPTFSNSQLAPLHDALLAFTGSAESWSQESERARQRAFRVRSCPRLFKYWYLRSQVLKRFQEGNVDAKQRREAAVATFFELESAAGRTNERLCDGWAKPWPSDTRRLLQRARMNISGLLGRFQLDLLPEYCDFSSGATTEQTRKSSSAEIKWEEATHVTRSALPYAIAFHQWIGFDQPICWQDEESGIVYQTTRGRPPVFQVVDGNEVFTVPKRFDTDRTCAKEPPWNVFLQKGVGGMIRAALNSVGLLLPDAQDTHARLARAASIDQLNATVDMKGASETVVVALVELLFEEPWARVLLDLRSSRGFVPGHGDITYEKISSMGNGYTFELETLIFWALAKACCSSGEEVSVYGDDLICPAHRVPEIRSLYEHCGFEFNLEKSFADGPFRESCGGHFWQGVDVKPFYVERLPRTLLQIVNLHNDIVRWMDDWPVQRLIDICVLCRRLVPQQFWGPLGLEGSLWSEWDEARPKYVSGRDARQGQPRYQHWRVSTVRREIVTQRHDYFRGSLLATYWRARARTGSPHHDSTPWWYDRSHRLNELARLLYRRDRAAVSAADFTYALTREVRGWSPVGVASDWPRLPVRIA